MKSSRLGFDTPYEFTAKPIVDALGSTWVRPIQPEPEQDLRAEEKLWLQTMPSPGCPERPSDVNAAALAKSGPSIKTVFGALPSDNASDKVLRFRLNARVQLTRQIIGAPGRQTPKALLGARPTKSHLLNLTGPSYPSGVDRSLLRASLFDLFPARRIDAGASSAAASSIASGRFFARLVVLSRDSTLAVVASGTRGFASSVRSFAGRPLPFFADLLITFLIVDNSTPAPAGDPPFLPTDGALPATTPAAAPATPVAFPTAPAATPTVSAASLPVPFVPATPIVPPFGMPTTSTVVARAVTAPTAPTANATAPSPLPPGYRSRYCRSSSSSASVYPERTVVDGGRPSSKRGGADLGAVFIPVLQRVNWDFGDLLLRQDGQLCSISTGTSRAMELSRTLDESFPSSQSSADVRRDGVKETLHATTRFLIFPKGIQCGRGGGGGGQITN
ncbi:hypothetical protein BDK51DRAFT_44272 [Blyttiomyces helicus]|uniref:Uncharacterized protein n=1 Tax=Blyttiomyces helicus TaxID=388810 RepID=A0A4P9WIQ8_9FUNG|nr:hypothetical protein BDK51DRAFT_44272 [Blyttiomyces helicus]|eukprot:RKO91020.1 hypothetical protein BDK51DRAFT_44272 [Blyttiomyces helicus]